jgi:MazG family protein
MTAELLKLIQVIETLRGPNGCTWDKAQNLNSMRPYLLEEVYELLDAIDARKSDAIKEELGDVLFVVLMLCQIGLDEQQFTLNSVCSGIVNKMINRHPKVFESNIKNQQKSTMAMWENEKAKQNPTRSRLDGVPQTLPALLRAHRQGEKAAAVGFDWPDYTGVLKKIEEELEELKEAIKLNSPKDIEHELGDVLLSVSSLGRHLNTPPEEALRTANNRFATRFKMMESIAQSEQTNLQDAAPKKLEEMWNQAKKRTS